ncbi:hypothetical protein [Curtobacterium sp. MCJR17_043]|uniref:hypothetical protein n=1 Tax=Curtobacterium sp. MCJR17_043 TaxID=2175660 RepID=UPI0024DF6400|nr:hypothetical protein [Curtobacterium sp. MCJR17_043]WIB36434.1 hypothetical protein DEJ15_04640 [Curtobacterium sp. MCJR17_043]
MLDTHIALERSGPTLHGTSTGDLDLDGEDDDLVLVVTVSGPTVDGRTTKQRSRAQVTPKEDGAVVTVRVPDAALWWPRGYGEQALHDVVVELQTVDGAVLDRRSFRTGFRSAGVRTALDSAGRPFEVVVNGTVIDVRGVNWIPDDVIVSRVDRARYAARLDAAVDLRANLVRVWGGGVYESHDFYELCDERGLLVWQDFPFACAAYPEDEPLRGEVIAEAQDNVARLSRHPSLVVWNGNNENIWLHDVDGWGGRARRPPVGPRLLPRPAADDRRRGRPVPLLHGGVAVVGVRVDRAEPRRPRDAPLVGRLEPGVRRPLPRLGAPVRLRVRVAGAAGLAHAPRRGDRRADDADVPPGWCTTRRPPTGWRSSRGGIEPRFGSAGDDLDRWHYLTQLQQARAIATGVEHWRTHWPRNTGVVVWQLNDLWPVSSWSAIDSAGRRKPLAHELRRLYDDVLVAIRPVSTVDTAVRAVPTEVDDRTGGPAPRTASLPVTDVAGSGTVPGDDGRDDPSRASDASPVEVAVRSARTGLDTVVRVRRIDLSGRILAEETLPVVLDRPGGRRRSAARERRCRGRRPGRGRRRGHGLAPGRVDAGAGPGDALAARAVPGDVLGDAGGRRARPRRRGRLPRPRPARAAGPGGRDGHGRPRVHDAAAGGSACGTA